MLHNLITVIGKSVKNITTSIIDLKYNPYNESYWYTLDRKRIGIVIYIDFITKKQAFVYCSNGCKYLIFYCQGGLSNESLLDYCKRTNIPYYD